MSSSNSTVTVENMRDHPLMPGRVLIAYDATRDRNELEFRHTINNIRSRGDILHAGDTLTVLGVLHKIPHPCEYLTLKKFISWFLFLLPFSFVRFNFIQWLFKGILKEKGFLTLIYSEDYGGNV